MDVKVRKCEKTKCPYNSIGACEFQKDVVRNTSPKEEWPKLREAFIQHGCRAEELVRAAAPAIILRES